MGSPTFGERPKLGVRQSSQHNGGSKKKKGPKCTNSSRVSGAVSNSPNYLVALSRIFREVTVGQSLQCFIQRPRISEAANLFCPAETAEAAVKPRLRKVVAKTESESVQKWNPEWTTEPISVPTSCQNMSKQKCQVGIAANRVETQSTVGVAKSLTLHIQCSQTSKLWYCLVGNNNFIISFRHDSGQE